jgi:hypothetical protein
MNEALGNPEESSFESAKTSASLGESLTAKPDQLPRMIDLEQIQAQVPEVGGTEIILQRHGKYIRDEGDPRVGSLTSKSEEEQVELGERFLKDLISQLPEDERDSFDVLIVASDTQYLGGGRRSLETASAVQRGMGIALEKAGFGKEHILNNVNPVRTQDGTLATGVPRSTPSLREPQMVYNEGFNNFLTENYGSKTLDYWVAFEEDRHAKERIAAGAEGPDDIADRTLYTVDVLKRYSDLYHSNHPDRRLIIWAATHYDTISPLVKLKLAGGDKSDALGVDYGAGISIDVTSDGRASTTIAGATYEVPLRQRD